MNQGTIATATGHRMMLWYRWYEDSLRPVSPSASGQQGPLHTFTLVVALGWGSFSCLKHFVTALPVLPVLLAQSSYKEH